MSDVMSQSEIDDLLSALNSGDVDVADIQEEKKEKRVRKYDFLRPDKFAKEHLRTLEVIHENFSRLLNNFLSGYLRTFIDIEVLNAESLIYSEFANAISNPAILGIIDFSPLEGQMILDFSSDVAFTMIERVLGGTASGGLAEKRSLTEIEMTLIRTIIMKFINLLKEPWSNIIELRPKLDTIETNSQFAQVISPSESVALITLNLKIGETEGMINLCYPHNVLEPILPNLSSKLWFTQTGKKNLSEEERDSLEKQVSKTKVDLKVELGNSFITVGEMLALGRGDVIVLDKKVSQELIVKVGDQVKFRGLPGKKNSNLAVRITEIFEEGDDLDG
ncbi:MAG: flagellar motor switch protein FliM [Clostridiales bacterium]|nr:flagellar motor switch protein FliM [Clostridiales bacterium]